MAEHEIENLVEFVILDDNCPIQNYNLDCNSSEPFKIQSRRIRYVERNQFYVNLCACFSSFKWYRGQTNQKQRKSSRCYNPVFKLESSPNDDAEKTDENQAAIKIWSFSLISSYKNDWFLCVNGWHCQSM